MSPEASPCGDRAVCVMLFANLFCFWQVSRSACVCSIWLVAQQEPLHLLHLPGSRPCTPCFSMSDTCRRLHAGDCGSHVMRVHLMLVAAEANACSSSMMCAHKPIVLCSGGPKRCNCKKSKCLKLYCDCFAAGVYCQNCSCSCCLNTEENKYVFRMTLCVSVTSRTSAELHNVRSGTHILCACHLCNASICLAKPRVYSGC